MTSRYILDAVERCKLAIGVAHDGTAFGIATHDRIWFPPTVWGANWIYSELVSQLQSVPAAPPLAGTAADSSSSPLGVS